MFLPLCNQLKMLESSQPNIDEPKILMNDIKWTALQIEYLHSQGIRIVDKEWFILKLLRFSNYLRSLTQPHSTSTQGDCATYSCYIFLWVWYFMLVLSSNDSFISLSIDGTMILFALLSMMKITLIRFGHRKSSFVVFERFQKYFSIRLTLQKHRTENLYKASGLGSNTQSLFIPYRFQDG